MGNSKWGWAGVGGKFLADTYNKRGDVNPYGALNPEQVSMVKALGPQLQSSATAGPQYYTGELSAEMSPEEAALYNPSRIGAMSGTLDQYLQEGTDQTAYNNRFNTDVATPTYQNFNQNELPGLLEGYSGFSTAAGNARAQALNTIGNNLMTQRFTGQEAAKDRALNAMGQYQNVSNFAATPRVIQQAGLDRKYQDYIQANSLAQANIEKALNFLGISTGTYTPPNTGLADALIGLTKSGMTMMAGMGDKK